MHGIALSPDETWRLQGILLFFLSSPLSLLPGRLFAFVFPMRILPIILLVIPTGILRRKLLLQLQQIQVHLLHMARGEGQHAPLAFPVPQGLADGQDVHPVRQAFLQGVIQPPGKGLPQPVSAEYSEVVRHCGPVFLYRFPEIRLCVAVFQSVVKPGYGEEPGIGLHLRDTLQFCSQIVRKQLVQAVGTVHFDGSIGVECAAVSLVDAQGAVIGLGGVFESPSETPYVALPLLDFRPGDIHMETQSSLVFCGMDVNGEAERGQGSVEYLVMAAFSVLSIAEHAVALRIFRESHALSDCPGFLQQVHALQVLCGQAHRFRLAQQVQNLPNCLFQFCIRF